MVEGKLGGGIGGKGQITTTLRGKTKKGKGGQLKGVWWGMGIIVDMQVKTGQV